MLRHRHAAAPDAALPAGAWPAGRRVLAAAGIGALLAQQAVRAGRRCCWRTAVGDVGALNVFQYAQAVYLLPYAVLAVPLATSAVPAAGGQRCTPGTAARFAATSARTTRAVRAGCRWPAPPCWWPPPAPVGRFFGVLDVAAVTSGRDGARCRAFAPGLVGFALIAHVGRALYALERGRAGRGRRDRGWLAAAARCSSRCRCWRGSGDGATAGWSALGLGSTRRDERGRAGLLLALRRVTGASARPGWPHGGCRGRCVGRRLVAAAAVSAVAGVGLLGVVLAGVAAAGAALARAGRRAWPCWSPWRAARVVLAVARPRDLGSSWTSRARAGEVLSMKVLSGARRPAAGGVGRHVPPSPSGWPQRGGHGVVVAGAGRRPPDDFGLGPGPARDPRRSSSATARPADATVPSLRLRALWPAADVVHAHGLRAGGLAALALGSRWRRSRTAAVVVTLHNAAGRGRAGAADAAPSWSGSWPAGADGGPRRSPATWSSGWTARRPAVRAGRWSRPRRGPPAGPPDRGAGECASSWCRPATRRPCWSWWRGWPRRRACDVLVRRAGAAAPVAPRPRRAGRRRRRAGRWRRRDRAACPAEDLPRAAARPARRRAPTCSLPPTSSCPRAVWEGQPLSVQEALRGRRRVVATDAGGTREVAGDAAVLVPPGDAATLADAVAGLLADPTERAAPAREAATGPGGGLPDRRRTPSQQVTERSTGRGLTARQRGRARGCSHLGRRHPG